MMLFCGCCCFSIETTLVAGVVVRGLFNANNKETAPPSEADEQEEDGPSAATVAACWYGMGGANGGRGATAEKMPISTDGHSFFNGTMARALATRTNAKLLGGPTY